MNVWPQAPHRIDFTGPKPQDSTRWSAFAPHRGQGREVDRRAGDGEDEPSLATIFSADDGCDVGEDSGSAVSPDYGSVANAFNGEVKGVQLSIAGDPNSSDNLVKPEDAIKAAMGRQ